MANDGERAATLAPGVVAADLQRSRRLRRNGVAEGGHAERRGVEEHLDRADHAERDRSQQDEDGMLDAASHNLSRRCVPLTHRLHVVAPGK